MGYLPQGTSDSGVARGGYLASGTVATGAGYATVATRTVPAGRTLNISRIVVTSPLAAFIRYRWNGAVIGVQRNMANQGILIEHFPKNWYPMVGNGVMAFEVRAVQDTASSTVEAEIDGEEV